MELSISEKINLEEMRAADPYLKNLSDEELEIIRSALYSMGQLSLESYLGENNKK